MIATPFQADCERKRNIQDPRLRWTACAECGVIRGCHYDTGHKFRKMTDREWKEYNSDRPDAEQRYSRKVMKVEGVFIWLECGHRQETAFANVFAPGVMTDCKQCESNKGERMWLNGRDKTLVNPGNNGRGSAENAPTVVEPSLKALVVSDNKNHNTAELARFMPVMDIEQAIARRDVIVAAMQRLMKEGVDYGTVGDGKKPGLLQPGADKLCNLFGLTLKYKFLEKEEDWTGERHNGEPFFYYQVGVDVFRAEFQIGEGVGSCNSRESKYRWRKGERLCPNCQQPSIRKSRDDGGGFYCWGRIGGCGAKFQNGDPTIEAQQVGRVPNGDIEDQVNTILKIAYKRAKISGTINATSASEFFTQDVEDFSVSEEPIDIGGRQPNSRAAQEYVRDEKIRTGNLNPQPGPWTTMAQMADAFKVARETVGETAYLEELNRYGWRKFQDLRNALDAKDAKGAGIRDKVADCYWHLVARKEGK